MNDLNIIDILTDELVRREKLADCLYMMISLNKRVGQNSEILAYVAECSGGAWSQYANISITDTNITINIKTIKGIVYTRFETQKFVFEICEPTFPDNTLEFLRKGAYYAKRAYEISRRKGWLKHRLRHGPHNLRRRRMQKHRIEILHPCRY